MNPLILAFRCFKWGAVLHTQLSLNLQSSRTDFKQWQAVFINAGSLLSWTSLGRLREDSSF